MKPFSIDFALNAIFEIFLPRYLSNFFRPWSWYLTSRPPSPTRKSVATPLVGTAYADILKADDFRKVSLWAMKRTAVSCATGFPCLSFCSAMGVCIFPLACLFKEGSKGRIHFVVVNLNFCVWKESSVE